jgi:hypothetical protein
VANAIPPAGGELIAKRSALDRRSSGASTSPVCMISTGAAASSPFRYCVKRGQMKLRFEEYPGG